LLLELRAQTESKGIEFRLMNVTRLVSRVLEITRLNTVFEMTSSDALLPAALGRLVPAMGTSGCAA